MGNWGPTGCELVKTLGAKGNAVSAPNMFEWFDSIGYLKRRIEWGKKGGFKTLAHWEGTTNSSFFFTDIFTKLSEVRFLISSSAI